MISFGCDYYPEQWSQWLDEGEARWSTDARLMAEAGFNTVRLAEFSWGLLEPEPDYYDFGWLDRAIACLQQEGLHVVLGTPTAAPPPWLLTRHPDITLVDEWGRRQGPGTRHEVCANHPVYQERSRKIVENMAKHYAGNDAVIGWQTDNEFGCHDSGRCYCDHCHTAFLRWLQARYHSLAELNHAWGGSFWGETYLAWDEIPLPTASSAERNPGHQLDFHRFSSDSWRHYQEQQIEILRDRCPGQFVTHNLMGFCPQLDYYDLCQNLDFVSWDNYHYYGATPGSIAAAHDHMRGILQRNFWVMEQQVGQVNWSMYNPAPPPNFVRLKTYQGIAHGADGILYFRWRQALAGSEQYHSGLLDNAGRPTRGYEEAKRIGSELKNLVPLLENTAPRPEIAILLDYDSRWALEMQPHNQQLRYGVDADHRLKSSALLMDDPETEQGQHMTGRAFLAWPYLAPYLALWEENIAVAIISPDSDLTPYKLVCAPFLNLLRPAVVENLIHYVKSGGTLVLGPRTGVKDKHNRLFPTPQPGPLTELTGTTVREFDSLDPSRSNFLFWHHGRTFHDTEVDLWAEILEVQGAEVVASYSQDWYARQPAITCKKTEEGQTIYVGCMGGPILYTTLFDWLLPQVGVEAPMSSVSGVELCARYGEDGRRVMFLLNHTNHRHALSLTSPIHDILSGQEYEHLLALEPGQVVVFEDY